MTTKIDCGLTNGKTGDAQISLVITEAQYAISDARGIEGAFVLAINTNGGAMAIDVTNERVREHVLIAQACADLGASWAEIKSAAIASYPAAAEWDWAEAPALIPWCEAQS